MKSAAAILALLLLTRPAAAELDRIIISPDGHSFVHATSGKPFTPWGFNYPAGDKLIEDYWETKWQEVVDDFREMHDLGANVVRIHLQVGHFLTAPDKPNAKSLERYAKLLKLAEETGLYLDVTGLACYRPADTPAWYNNLNQADHWKAQANFWSAIAEAGAKSNAIFCYDLINEPVVANGERQPGQWSSGRLFGGLDFIQFINIEAPTKSRLEIASDWIKSLTSAIRAQDPHHLITVGLLPPAKGLGLFSGFFPDKVAPDVDFIAVHVYPETGKLDEAQSVVAMFAVGKPTVIEESFNLACTAQELRGFVLASRSKACGWMFHYSGTSLAELNAGHTSGQLSIADSMLREMLLAFRELGPQVVDGKAAADANAK